MCHWKYRKPAINAKALSILVNANAETMHYIFIKL